MYPKKIETKKMSKPSQQNNLGQPRNCLFSMLMMVTKMHAGVNIMQCCHCVLPDLAMYWHKGIGRVYHYVAKAGSPCSLAVKNWPSTPKKMHPQQNSDVDDTLPSMCVPKRQPTASRSTEGGRQFATRTVGDNKGGGQWWRQGGGIVDVRQGEHEWKWGKARSDNQP